MKLTFESLTLESIGSYAKAQTLDLRRTPGLYFLKGQNKTRQRLGSNGAGKTTLWRALTWVLYGRTASGLRTTDLVPWSGKGGSRATVRLSNAEITRSTDPNRIEIDGRVASQPDIDALLGGLSLHTFANTVVFPQGEETFLSLKPRNQLQLLADVLQLERWDRRAAKTSKRASDLQNRESDLLGEITGLGTSLVHLKKLLKTAQDQSEEWEEDNNKQVKDRERLKKELQTTLNKLEQLLGEAQEDRDRTALRTRELRGDLVEAKKQYQKRFTAHNQSENNVSRCTADRKRLEKELAAFGDVCPTCGQSLRGNQLRTHKRKIESQLKDLRAEEKRLSKWFAYTNELLEDADDYVLKLENDIAESEKAEDKAEAAVSLHAPRVAETKVQLRSLTGAEEISNPHTETVRGLRRQISAINADIEEMSITAEKLARRIERTRYWIKGFRDVSLFIVEEVLAEIEAACNHMLPEVGLEGWELQFAVERETGSKTIQRGLNVTVLSPNNPKPVRWESWSGGEAQRLKVVGALALSEVLLGFAGIDINLEVLDEPTEHMSPEGTRDLCAFLAGRAEEIERQTWWVDQTAIESSYFSGVTTVIRTDKGSQIVERND